MPIAACIIGTMPAEIQRLLERTGTRIVLPESNGDRYKIRIMGWEPGSDTVEGSSGDYPVAAIKRDFGAAFPPPTRMRANHDGLCDAGGDVRRVMAKTEGKVWFEDDGAYVWSRVMEGEASDFLRQFADAIGVSVSVGVELEKIAATDDEGEPIVDHENNPVMVVKLSERGVPIIKRFLTMEDSPYNSIDFVEAPGADGRIVAAAVESAKSIYEHTTLKEAATFTRDVTGKREKDSKATPPRKSKEKKMEPDEIQAIAEAVAPAVTAAVVEALRPAPSASEEPTLGQQTEAVVTAGLSEAGRTEVYRRVESGETLEDAIAAEAAREAGIESEVDRRVTEALEAQRTESVLPFGFTEGEGAGLPVLDGGKGNKEEATAAFDTMFGEADEKVAV